MPPAKPTTKSAKPWRKEYIRILTSGTTVESDFPLVRELTNEHLLDATLVPDMSAPGNESGDFHIRGPTVKGRVFADELQTKLNSESLRARLLKALLVVGGWAGGIASSIIVGWFT